MRRPLASAHTVAVPRTTADISQPDERSRAAGGEWTDAQTLAAWRRWGAAFAALTRPLSDLLLQAAQVREGMRVLDLASGAGEPAFALARAVGPLGQVVATDVADGMLGLIEDGARERGLDNLTARAANAESLPFADATFDRVTSRLGIMHVPDAAGALEETRRVLKPGGRAAFLVWGPPHEQTMMLHQAILARHLQAPRPAPGAPGPFRFAQPGALTAALQAAGFWGVQENTHRVVLTWDGTPDEWWQHTQELAAPLRATLARLPAGERVRIDQEVHAALVPFSRAGRVSLDAVVHIASAVTGGVAEEPAR